MAAANGPRSLRFAARTADAWVTTGSKVETVEEWWTGLDGARHTLEEALVGAGRDPASFPRYLNLDSSPQFSPVAGSSRRWSTVPGASASPT